MFGVLILFEKIRAPNLFPLYFSSENGKNRISYPYDEQKFAKRNRRTPTMSRKHEKLRFVPLRRAENGKNRPDTGVNRQKLGNSAQIRG